ncbi:mechanosensitive ion channel family protein [Rubrivirga sp.]|uniref:mechanosensitive ion channel family protein n=1 Tax=Rubrivirga sp. TaxID=1885344 RepID=UPI003C732A41
MAAVRLLLLALALATPATGQVDSLASAAVDTSVAALDSASVAADSAEVENVVTLSDSAAVQLDSAAVAALEDSTSTMADVLGEGVDVDLVGRILFKVWGDLGAFSPEMRAERISARLADLARSREIDPAAIQVVDGETTTALKLGDLIVMSVTDEDASALGLNRALAATRYRNQIVEAVLEFREQATLRGVLWGAGRSAIALVALILALRGLGWLYGWLDQRTVAVRRLYLRGVKIGTLEVVGKDQVARFGRGLTAVTRIALSLVLVYFFLTYAFSQFAWTQSWGENLLSAALTPLRQLGATVAASIDNVIAIIVIIAVVRYTIRIADYLFTRVARGEAELKGFHAELADPTRKIVKFLLVVMGVMLIYPYTPIANNRGFQGLTVFFGLLISLGSSTAISNVVAGIVLTYTRAFRIGDRVRIGEAFGDVVEKSFLVTRIRTTKNEDISVPNANVLSNHIVNYSAMARDGSGVVLNTEITIGYDVPWPKVHQLLIQAARDTVGTEPEPPPFVLQTALGDFSVAYQLNAYTKEVMRMSRLYSDMHQHIQDRFAEADVEILSPTYEARRDGPSTVPDVAAIHDAAARFAATTPARETDGADVMPEEDPADLPDVTMPRLPEVELPKFLRRDKPPAEPVEETDGDPPASA